MIVDINRCSWCNASDLYKKYHDQEWGTPVFDDGIFFEFILLESFQAGLSWLTILNKRINFRTAFDYFDYHKIANYDDDKIAELLQNPGIIRNKLKIFSAIVNAQQFLKIQQEYGSFSNFIWQYVDNKPIVNNPKDVSQIIATSAVSNKISKDLKKRGFKFLGATTIYAFMQATGLVNDHFEYCFKNINNL